MGLIKAVKESIGGVMGDQWREFFYCEALDSNTLITKGVKRINSGSSNTKGRDNIISNGSLIAVADGQCMLIVEQGKVVDVCAEPGEYKYDTSTEPSVFSGSLGKNIIDTFKTMGKRFTFGGDTAKDQRVYYINTKELMGNKFGTSNPIPFKVVVSEEMGFKLSVDLRCNGEYSYKIVNPILFYTNVCGNVGNSYNVDELESMMKSELLSALQPALAQISAQKIEYSEIPAHTMEITKALNEVLSFDWRDRRGIEISKISFNSINVPEEQRAKITEWEENVMTMNPNVAGARIVSAQADAMRDAANNANGSLHGFFGMNMAQQVGGAQAQTLYGMGAIPNNGAAVVSANQNVGWVCQCGATNQGKFCSNCGSQKPAVSGWTCSCGQSNTGKFCSNCGSPAPMTKWTCSCGVTNEGKFCSNCGKPQV